MSINPLSVEKPEIYDRQQMALFDEERIATVFIQNMANLISKIVRNGYINRQIHP
jgi:hypothetical protein